MNNTANKKDIFYITVLILTFVTVVVGAAFAIYALIFSQEEGSSAVYTGTLSIEYIKGNIINCNLLYPTEKPSFDTEENVYKNNFKVSNTGSLDTLLEIGIDINQNEFSENTLMYSLYNDEEEELAEGNINGDNLVILTNNLLLEKETTEEFTLIIWIMESGEQQNEEMKKTLTGLINVDASQKLE